jgi:hypothetical protein
VPKQKLTKPCGDCPWRRVAEPGHTADWPPEKWVELVAKKQIREPCHVHCDSLCAGLAIFRANCGFKIRAVPRLPEDRERVFASPEEFIQHHQVKE